MKKEITTKIKLARRYSTAWAIVKENAFREGAYDVMYPLYETEEEAKMANKKEKGLIRKIKITLCPKK